MKAFVRVLSAALLLLLYAAMPVSAQITTGNVSGTVNDSQGGVVPGATVVLISQSKGTKIGPVVTNEAGTYVIPNVTADTYTVEVSMEGFKTVRRSDIRVTGGERVGVPALTLEVGGATETVNVTAEAALVQSQSAERSFGVSTEQIENLPINHGNFISVTQLTPGVQNGGNSAGATRIGGAGQNNIMMDGISAMDTGNNGQMLNMNIESIAEVKVLTQGYQAEFGRSSGLQITAVTKSGTNHFRGSVYDLITNSDWNTNRKVTNLNGDPKPVSESKTYGYSLGGPVGKPGGSNKLFFFYSHEFRPSNQAINSGNPIRIKVPTALERAGDFSQSVDNNGAPVFIRDPLKAGACSATDQTACFAGNRIPQDRLYSVGLALLNRYAPPNRTQTPGSNYNYELGGAGSPPLPTVDNLVQQPAIRVDYQLSSKLRVNGKYSGQRERVLTRAGLIPGFTDVLFPYPFITNYAVTANYALNPTTFIEGTYGFIRNELTGGNENGILMNDSSNRLSSLAGFPMIYPDAGLVPQRSYAYEVLQDTKPPFWDGTRMNLPPVFAWGGRIAPNGNNNLPAPPNQRYPGWLNINRTQDISVSLTKVAGRHTMKGGFYNNHSFKAQNVGAGGIANLSFQGFVDFGNDTNNTLDSGYGYSNAALGVFRQYLQASNFVEGSMLYNNTEGYIQDNWKVNNRLTLDYGLRLTHQQPQYDQFQQMSNFFPNLWKASDAPQLYIPGCSNGATTCSGNTLNAMNPQTGEILTAPGAANSQAAIGTPVPGTGKTLNGIVQAGNGIAKTGYTWPNIVLGPRFGMAYDISGNQSLVFRGGAGVFYDRPDGNTVFSIPGNPPMATSTDLRNGTLQNLGQGLSFGPVPALVTFQYEAKVPASVQWQAGVQKTLPWASVVDVSYVGNHGYNRLGSFQGGTTVNQNAIDIGTAYLPQSQDATKGESPVPGQNAYTTNLLRPYRGLSNIAQNTTEFWDDYHSIQSNFNRRFRNGFSFGVNYTLSLSFTGNTGLQRRLVHNSDGSISLRSDQAEYEKLNDQLNLQRHLVKANWVWDLPDWKSDSSAGKALGYIINDWQVSGLFTGGSGNRYDLNYSYNNNGGAVNLTGSPDYNAKIVINGDLGSGCSSNQYKQFNTAAVSGPTYHSVGLESGRNYLVGCPDHTTDLAIARNIRVGGGRLVQLRLDAFNAFNTAIITGRNTTITYTSPTDQTVRNSQYLADGTVDPNRIQPRNAGFGAANAWSTNQINTNYTRFIQFTLRFQF
jgi:carboxypeptidase family protein